MPDTKERLRRSADGMGVRDPASYMAGITVAEALIAAEARRKALEEAAGLMDRKAAEALEAIRHCRPYETDARAGWLYDKIEAERDAKRIRALITKDADAPHD